MAVWTTTPRSWTVGEVVTAANVNAQLRDFANGFGAWGSYTATVSGFTSVVTTPVANYRQVQKDIAARVQITITTVTTLGAAAVTFLLPVAASATTPANNLGVVGTAMYRTNGSVYTAGVITATASSTAATTRIATPGAANPNLSAWTGAVPAGQVAGDTWEANLTYESV